MLLLIATVAVLAIVATSAYARISHAYESVIEPSEPLVTAKSMTVHLGDLYIAEELQIESGSGESRTEEYAPSITSPGKYEFVSQLKEPSPEKNLDRGIAFGTAAGETEMYVGEEGGPAGVDVFGVGPCRTLECTSLQEKWTGTEVPGGSFGGRITDVAVDQSMSGGDWASGDVFVDDAFAHRIDIFEPQVGGKEKYVTDVTGLSPTELFGEPKSIAVSGFNGDLVVGEDSEVYVFRPEEEGVGTKKGKYVLMEHLVPPSGPLKEVTALAVDDGNGEIYVATSTAIYEFGPEGLFRGETTVLPREGTPAGGKGEREEVGFNVNSARPVSIAVDPDPLSHRVLVGVYDSEEPTPHKAVVDVFSADVVIPDVETGEPSSLELKRDGGTGAHSWSILSTGTVDPNDAGEASCWFVWGIAGGSLEHVAPCEHTVANGDSPVGVVANLSGLEPDTKYVYRLQAKNAKGTNLGEENQNYEFTTPGPGLREESVSAVSSSSATLDATIVPHDAPVEQHDLQALTVSPTTYYFQYSTQSTDGCVANPSVCTNVPLSVVSVGSGVVGVEVEQHVQGLAPGTIYHYRVVAANEALPESQPNTLTEFYGPDQTFTTQAPGRPLVLLDGREWELVSPVDKHGATVQPIAEVGLVQAAADGGAFTYLTSSPTESEPRGYGNFVQVLSSRGVTGGWSSEDLALSHSAPVGALVGVGEEYRFFSEDLGVGIAESFGPFSVPEGWHLKNGQWERVVEASPIPTERTPYLRHDSGCQTEPETCYEPLLTKESVTSKEKFGGDPEHDAGEASFVGATPDGREVVIGSRVALMAGAPGGALYEWAADKPATERLELVSLLPEDEGGKGSGAGFGDSSEAFVNVARRMVSGTGSRVFFSAKAPEQAHEHLYMRDTVKGETVRLDVAENGSPLSQGPAVFQIASVDGSRAFFTDSAQLTKGANSTGSDLYECETVVVVESGKQKLKCDLSDLTPAQAHGQPGAGESADVLRVLGASEDGSYVYFVADGVLAAGASHGNNLYVAHEEAGKWTTSLVTTLSEDDFPDWTGGTFRDLGHMTARVSPDGQWVAFMSDRSLTGYDNRDAKSGMLDEEVYLYSAVTGKVVCASCDPSGARPVGVEYKKLDDRLAGGDRVWPDGQWLAANVPGWTPYQSSISLYQSRYLSDSGRLFFNSSDALVSQDTNGNEDVYEYEPSKVGNCSSASLTFSAGVGGCVGLISSGVAFGESAFLDASETGGDVFFMTEERLVPQDVDTALDVYDAHECPNQSSCPNAPPAEPRACESAASCRAAPLPQPSLYGAPSSATFSGTGNVVSGAPPAEQASAEKTPAQLRQEKLARALKACKKKKGRGIRRACERKAHAKYGPVKSSRRSARRSSEASVRSDRARG